MCAYVAWMAKEKNGSIDRDTSTADWYKKYNAPNAIVDQLGPTANITMFDISTQLI